MKKYKCPMHPQVTSAHPGTCHICKMDLVSDDEQTKEHVLSIYSPLLIIFCLLLVVSFLTAYPQFNLKDILSSFMAGFFIVFAGFKLIDLKGFANGYKTYDLLASKWPFYGYIYPFIELFFGLSMIIALWQTEILWAEVIIMTFSGIGVMRKLLKREKFQCVCLGTFLKVPLTKVTLIENFGMALLALIMLYLG